MAERDYKVEKMVALLASHLLRISRAEDRLVDCRHETKDLSNAALELDISIVQFSLLALLICSKQDALLVERLQIYKTIETEAPGGPA